MDWKVLPATCSGSGLFGTHSVLEVDLGPVRVSIVRNEKEYY